MNRVFEDFVVVALREALDLTPREFPQGSSCPPLYLAERNRVRLRPDISWWDVGRPAFVRRRQVQAAQPHRLSERRPLPAPRLLHRRRPSWRNLDLREGRTPAGAVRSSTRRQAAACHHARARRTSGRGSAGDRRGGEARSDAATRRRRWNDGSGRLSCTIKRCRDCVHLVRQLRRCHRWRRPPHGKRSPGSWFTNSLR